MKLTRKTATAAGIAVIAVSAAACGSGSTSSARTVSAASSRAATVSATDACNALLSWENSGATGTVNQDAGLAKTFSETVQPLSRDFAAWIAAINARNGASQSGGNAVESDCLAYGVEVFPSPPPYSPPATPVTTPPPAPAAPATSAPAAPSMTVAQQQAVDAAQGYLSLGSGFSKAGLIQQLTSSAGSGFAPADAGFAVTYLHPDWDAQALDAAKGYMALGGFSRESLLQQLTSPYGGQFTTAQATYAVNAVGL